MLQQQNHCHPVMYHNFLQTEPFFTLNMSTPRTCSFFPTASTQLYFQLIILRFRNPKTSSISLRALGERNFARTGLLHSFRRNACHPALAWYLQRHNYRSSAAPWQGCTSLPSLCCWLLVSFNFFSFSIHTAADVHNTL